MDRVDLEREQDIEELRRFALAQHAQLQLLMELIDKQRRELGRARGKTSDFQLTLKMLEELKAKTKQTQEALAKATATKQRERKPRTRHSWASLRIRSRYSLSPVFSSGRWTVCARLRRLRRLA